MQGLEPFLTNVLILSHEKEVVYVEELLIHMQHNLPEDVRIFSMGDIAASDERIDVLCSELKQAHIAIVVMSSNLIADDVLYNLHQCAIQMHDAEKIETIQILARSVYFTTPKNQRPIKTIPLRALSMYDNDERDIIYLQIIDFIIDKIDIIKLKLQVLKQQLIIKELTDKLRE